MNNNNQSSFKSGLTIGAIAVLVLLLGWALLKNGNTPPTSAVVGDLNNLKGKPLPSMQFYDKDGKPYTVSSLKGKNVVLFFNEGIMCYPACWNQVAQLGTDSRFNSSDTVAFSIVLDQPSQWEQAINKMPDLAKATLLFDQGGNVSRSLGMLTLPSSMHKGSNPGHTYIVLDKSGVVRYVLDDPKMAINNDLLAQEIAGFKN